MRDIWRELVYYLGLLTYLGIAMAVSVGLGFLAGQWLDASFKTGYTFTIAGSALGAVAGFIAMYKLTTAKIDKRDS